ncbi:uncharacterized protein BCR38DRAFT_440953 [Pseudomassariella vexata]|uniref:Uncharacterized protein n=1 Tax=Pseudomassariella vexata TaxID=1141098 RepID=A0A1Y2DSS7_9PEZI|nr:uncharacterized protein BCR38DRAFT_440953 [Pseudomassariella vexata]ORY61715.1 hypothetical protein BCR38DRAFT_440953 [Pseudomassariella vexata]
MCLSTLPSTRPQLSKLNQPLHRPLMPIPHSLHLGHILRPNLLDLPPLVLTLLPNLVKHVIQLPHLTGQPPNPSLELRVLLLQLRRPALGFFKLCGLQLQIATQLGQLFRFPASEFEKLCGLLVDALLQADDLVGLGTGRAADLVHYVVGLAAGHRVSEFPAVVQSPGS